jgi:nucleotide-binding universal stress UspA family protein
MYRVLVPIDTDADRARAQATVVRRLPAAEETVVATVLHVFDDADRAETTSIRQLSSGKAAIQELEGARVTVETMSRHGDAADEILAAADEVEAELIVMGGRKRSPLGALLFGSVVRAVTVDATRPVTVTGDVVEQEPSHRCRDCGEAYYTDLDTEIRSCRSCGGSDVRAVERGRTADDERREERGPEEEREPEEGPPA